MKKNKIKIQTLTLTLREEVPFVCGYQPKHNNCSWWRHWHNCCFLVLIGSGSNSPNDKYMSLWDGSISIPSQLPNYGFKISKGICLLWWLRVVMRASFTYSKYIPSSKHWKSMLLKCICHTTFFSLQEKQWASQVNNLFYTVTNEYTKGEYREMGAWDTGYIIYFTHLLLASEFVSGPFWRLSESWGFRSGHLRSNENLPTQNDSTWWFKVTFLGWLSDPFKGLSDLQLADEKGTLNHLVCNVSM